MRAYTRKAYTYNIQLQRAHQTAHSACSVYHVVNTSSTAESGYKCIETNTMSKARRPFTLENLWFRNSTNELLLHIKLNMHCPMYWVFPFAHACLHGGGLENEIRVWTHGTWARTRIVDIIQIFKLFRTFQSWTFHSVYVQW